MPAPLLIVFDVDGTLVDSQANIITAMGDAFDRHHLTAPDPHAIRRIVGLSLLEAVQALLPQADAALQASLADDYKTAFQRLRGQGLVDEPLFPGAREAIESFHRAGMLLGIATGKSDRGLAKCLETHGLAAYFMTLQTADRHPSKPHPAMLRQAMADAAATPGATVMIGDTMFDIEMAGAAGATAIGVSWGYHENQELTQAGASHVAHSYADLVQHVLAGRR